MDVPAKLSELIAAMLSRDPLARPDAIAVAHELPLTLDLTDWKELALSGHRAYDDTDIPRALETYEKAVFLAPRSARSGDDYVTMLGRFLEVVGLAESTAKVTLLPQLAQLVTDLTLNGPGRDVETGGAALKALVEQAIQLGAPDDPTKAARREVIGVIASLLLDHAPRAATVLTVQEFLGKIHDPVCWERRADLYLVASRLVAAGLMASQPVVTACISASRIARMAGEDIAQSQNWLRRAARLGAGRSQSYLDELQAVEGQIHKTATPVRLPADAEVQASADDVVGDDEKGHLQVKRIRDWARRLLDLYRWVEAVKRVRKDPGLPPHSTRLLDLQNLSQHVTAVKSIEQVRIIPAVLDGGHSLPQGCSLRINIILPKGTTEAQRAAAMDALRADKSLFP